MPFALDGSISAWLIDGLTWVLATLAVLSALGWIGPEDCRRE